MRKILVISLLLLIPVVSFAWDDCPYGEVNDPYPGECGRYVDTNNDQLCDRSQPAPDVHDLITGQDLKTKTVGEVAAIYGIDKKEYAEALSEYYNSDIEADDSFQYLHDNYGLEPSTAKDIATSLATSGKMDLPEKDRDGKEYNLIIISLVTLLLYFVSNTLSKNGKMTVARHRQIWNVVLLISFLISAILGILLVIRISYGYAINLPFNILYWHVELGIVMIIISIAHIIWHLPYYKTILKKKEEQ